jgi:NAD(P)-dependent dehydrogenase (short-subunit alcohol dehydrogenase family)
MFPGAHSESSLSDLKPKDQERLFKNKVALVTGASRGIGKATALALGHAGAAVAIIARSLQELELVQTSLDCGNAGQ